MKNHLLPLIMENNVSELTKQVFNQKLTESSSIKSSSYTLNLSEEEENAAAKQTLAADSNSDWFTFWEQYITHYPLFNSTDRILLENLDDPNVVHLISCSISRYGYNEECARKICDYAEKKNDETCLSLLSLLCENSRIFYADIHYKLEHIDDRRKAEKLPELNFAESYMQGIKSYHSSNGVFSHKG